MAQLTIYALDSLPPTDLSGLTKDADYLFVVSRDYLRVRLNHTSASASVRPYYRFGSAWVPLRGDADDAVTVKPVTVDSTKLNGWAEGVFHAAGLSAPCILVIEAGEPDDLTGYLDIADTED